VGGLSVAIVCKSTIFLETHTVAGRVQLESLLNGST